jgi:SAM-dependent methyltransferase
VSDGNHKPKWYEAWFDRDEYKVVYGHRNEDEATRLLNLIERTATPRPGSRILDMGCGRGRHALQLAGRGFSVTGVDLSPRSIETARELRDSRGLSVDFQVGDMRDQVCDGCFDIVVNLFTAFGYFEDEHEHVRALAAMSGSLTVNGWMIQDFMNAENVQRSLVAEDHRTSGDFEIVQRRSIANGRINKTIQLTGPQGAHTFNESVRLLRLEELDRMYRSVGLLMTHVFGDYDGGPLTPESPRLLMFARRIR